ncbi:MAG: AAA family ATPase, partial [Desulfotignum sp.]
MHLGSLRHRAAGFFTSGYLNTAYTIGYRNFKDLCGLFCPVPLPEGSRTGQQESGYRERSVRRVAVGCCPGITIHGQGRGGHQFFFAKRAEGGGHIVVIQWFFSFYTAFAADTENGDKDTAILLLDEPGLYLHAKSQGDLLTHLEDDFENQILYTTHSPFMVPTKHLDWVRTVNIAEADGTTVTNNPSGDRKTLFPLQAALGYDLAQSLFLGGSNLIVEGVTD